MTESRFASLRADGVTIKAQLETDVLRIVMTGSLESRDPRASFDPYWTALDDAIRRERVTRVVLDIRGLEYMNSSGILTLARWLMKVTSHSTYQVVIEHDPDLTWQHSNVPVLAKLAPAVVQVDRGSLDNNDAKR
jgi:hypothetical protein